MKKMIALALMALCVSCGGSDNDITPNGDESCGFEFSAITNGPNGESLSSYWKCTTAGPFGVFALTDDGNGVSIVSNGEQANSSGFFWDETACAQATFSGENLATGEDFVSYGSNFVGSRASGKLTLTLTEGSVKTEIACSLDTN